MDIKKRILPLGFLLLLVAALVSCLPSEEEPTLVIDEFGSTFKGKWDINGVAGGDGTLFVGGRNFYFLNLPAGQVAREVWQDGDITGAVCEPCIVAYSAVASSGANVVYSFASAEWEIKALVGGMERSATLFLKPTATSLEGQSWATCAKSSGVMTVFLHIDACSEEGDVRPLGITMTFTGVPDSDGGEFSEK